MNTPILTGCSGIPSMHGFRSKADALKYAIEFTAGLDSSINQVPNYEAAKKLFTFICENVSLPDVEQDKTAEFLDYAKAALQETIKKEPTEGKAITYGDLMLMLTKHGFEHLTGRSDDETAIDTYQLRDEEHEYTVTISRRKILF